MIMERRSGKIKIDSTGKVILTAEIYDEHGSFDFDAIVDTGSSFGMVITKGLADAVCAKVLGEIENISIGGGTDTINGQLRVANFRFGDLLDIPNYKVIVTDGTRNLIGVKFFQDNNILLMIDFKGTTSGSLITNDRKFASALGKTTHYLEIHKNDITKSNEPCTICGARGE